MGHGQQRTVDSSVARYFICGIWPWATTSFLGGVVLLVRNIDNPDALKRLFTASAGVAGERHVALIGVRAADLPNIALAVVGAF